MFASTFTPSSLVISKDTWGCSDCAAFSLSRSFTNQDLGDISFMGEFNSSSSPALATTSWSQFICLTVWGIDSSKLIVLFAAGGVFLHLWGAAFCAGALGKTGDGDFSTRTGLRMDGKWLVCRFKCSRSFLGEFVGEEGKGFWGAGRILLSLDRCVVSLNRTPGKTEWFTIPGPGWGAILFSFFP